MSLQPQQDVGPFRLDAKIGVGGMGEVWQARHRTHGTAVAIKVVTSNRATQDRYRDVFMREVQAVAALNHPGVVAIYEYGEVAGSRKVSLPWYAMELAETSLGEVIVEDWPTLHRVLVEMLDALAHAHARGVIHRDLKPENVLLTLDLSVKLTDFGMAHVTEYSNSTGNVFGPGGGTPDFMAPEQFRGTWRKFGPWTDLYALGCMAWELATGSPPFTGESVVDIAMRHMNEDAPRLAPLFEVPDRFEVWLRQLIQKHPLDRYRRAADAQWALVHDVGGVSSSKRVALRSRPGVPTASDIDVLETYERDAPRLPRDTWDMHRKSSAETLVATYGLTPPFPATWRTDHTPSKLGGAGLGLFGIREIPYVDRDEERELVWQQLRAVDDSRENRVVLVRGEPGSGRTRFAQWISRRAHELGAATVIRAVHAPIASKRDGLSGAITRFLGIDGIDADRAEEVVFDRLGPSFDPRLLFDLLFKSGAEESAGGGTSTFIAPNQRYAAVEKLFHHLSWERPVVLMADDVQWGADTLLFIQHLMKANSRTLVLATVRDDSLPDRYWESQLVDELLRTPGVTDFTLKSLDTQSRLELIGQMLDLESTLAARVAQRSQGIPLFAVQLVGDWVQRGLLVETKRGFALSGDVALDLPDDVYQLWTQRIEELARSLQNPAVREILEVAAVLGRGDDEWRRACEERGLQIPSELVEHLITRRLAHREDKGWTFQHGMLREALERSVEESGRAPAVYLACAAAADRSDPYRVAEFQVRAGRYSDAIDSLIRALQVGIMSAAVDQSLQLVEVIRELLEEVRAPAHDRRRGTVVEAQVALTRLAGHNSEARRLASELARDAHRFGWRTIEGDARLHLGSLGQLLDEPIEDVLRQFDEALSIFDELDDDQGRARAYRALAGYHLTTGRNDAAANLAEKALTILEAANDDEGTIDCLVAMGDAMLAQASSKEARAWYQRALDMAQRLKFRHLEAAALAGLGQIARREGAVETAERHFADACELWVSVGSPLAAEAAVHLALVHIDRLELDEAGELLDEVVRDLSDLALPSYGPIVFAAMMAIAAHRGNTREFDRYREKLTAAQRVRSARGTELGKLSFIAGGIWSRRRDKARARSSFDIARDHFLALGEQRLADEVAIAIGKLARE